LLPGEAERLQGPAGDQLDIAERAIGSLAQPIRRGSPHVLRIHQPRAYSTVKSAELAVSRSGSRVHMSANDDITQMSVSDDICR
jgi:hypothetical protein